MPGREGGDRDRLGAGIGRATAELLVEHGARVLVNDLDGDVAEQAAAEIAAETAVFGGDLTAQGVPDALVQAAVDSFGQLDIVVNNAGYTWDGMAHKLSDEQFRAMLEIHTVVPFRVLRAAAPHLRDAGKKDREEGRRGHLRRRRARSSSSVRPGSTSFKARS